MYIYVYIYRERERDFPITWLRGLSQWSSYYLNVSFSSGICFVRLPRCAN